MKIAIIAEYISWGVMILMFIGIYFTPSKNLMIVVGQLLGIVLMLGLINHFKLVKIEERLVHGQ